MSGRMCVQVLETKVRGLVHETPVLRSQGHVLEEWKVGTSAKTNPPVGSWTSDCTRELADIGEYCWVSRLKP